MKTIYDQLKDAEQAYKEMLGLFLNEIIQVDEKTPWSEYEPNWWLDMMRINRLVQECKENLGG